MKVDVDYALVFAAMEKLRGFENLTSYDKQILLTVLEAVQGDYIPTPEALVEHINNIKRLNNMDPAQQPEVFDRIFQKCIEFDNQYS